MFGSRVPWIRPGPHPHPHVRHSRASSKCQTRRNGVEILCRGPQSSISRKISKNRSVRDWTHHWSHATPTIYPVQKRLTICYVLDIFFFLLSTVCTTLKCFLITVDIPPRKKKQTVLAPERLLHIVTYERITSQRRKGRVIAGNRELTSYEITTRWNVYLSWSLDAPFKSTCQ